MLKRLMVGLIAIALVGATACGALAAAHLKPLPDDIRIDSIAGSVAYGKEVGPGGAVRRYAAWNLATGKTTYLDKYGDLLQRENPSSMVSSSYGFAASHHPLGADVGALDITLSKPNGSTRVLESTTSNTGLDCDSSVGPVDIDDAGNVTVLRVTREPESPGSMPVRCKIVPAQTSLYRLSPAGTRTELWFPSKYKEQLGLGQAVIHADTLVVVGGKFNAKSRVTFLDVKKRRVLRTFIPPGTRGQTQLQISDTGATLVSRTNVRATSKFEQFVYLVRRPTSRAVLIRQSKLYAQTLACGNRVAVADAPRGGQFRRFRLFSAGGKVVFERTFGKKWDLSVDGCSNAVAALRVNGQTGGTVEHQYWLPLGPLGK